MGFSCPAQITVVKPIPARATITIDAGKPAGAPIPRTIFGSFLEPIGNSTYNGLWAELLINPSLEENLWSAKNLETLVHERPELVESSSLGLPLPWEPLNAKQGNRYEPRWGTRRELLAIAGGDGRIRDSPPASSSRSISRFSAR